MGLYGLIVAIVPVPKSVTQRLPSGPAVMLKPVALAFGRANTLMASVVGLIIPIWIDAGSREPEVAVGPAVIPLAEDPLGVETKLKASVVGLNSSDGTPSTVNQRLPSEPAAIYPT